MIFDWQGAQMGRRKKKHPTPGELEVLKILWDRGPSTIRQVWEVLNRQRKRHYMSAKCQLDAMVEKGLLMRKRQGRAFIYRARVARDRTIGQMVDDLLGRVFEGSASGLVVHLLDQAKPSPDEMEKIQATIDEYLKQQGEM